MSTTTAEMDPTAVGSALRMRVRDRLEREYLRLRSVDRPALLRALGAGAHGVDGAPAGRDLAIVDYRIAAIHDYLGTVHAPHPDNRVGLGSCVLLDRGDGPHWFLLTTLPVDGERVIVSDSALGRALIGARPGQVVQYPHPAGVQTAEVLEMESSDARELVLC
jgi:transcription elongation GreA/GreB family factor